MAAATTYPAYPAPKYDYVSAAICLTWTTRFIRVIVILQPPQPYNFAYAVKDDPSYNDYGHQETSDGKVVSGSYRVLLPDGRVQTVNYKVDGYSGYVADVQYEGVAKYPEYKAAYPAYKPAYPAYKPAYPWVPSPSQASIYVHQSIANTILTRLSSTFNDFFTLQVDEEILANPMEQRVGSV